MRTIVSGRRFDVPLEPRQPPLPFTAVPVQPCVDRAQRLGVDGTESLSSLSPRPHQSDAAEQAQMLRDRGPTHCKPLRDLTHSALAIEQHVEDLAPRGIGNGAEDGGRGRVSLERWHEIDR